MGVFFPKQPWRGFMMRLKSVQREAAGCCHKVWLRVLFYFRI